MGFFELGLLALSGSLLRILLSLYIICILLDLATMFEVLAWKSMCFFLEGLEFNV